LLQGAALPSSGPLGVMLSGVASKAFLEVSLSPPPSTHTPHKPFSLSPFQGLWPSDLFTF